MPFCINNVLPQSLPDGFFQGFASPKGPESDDSRDDFALTGLFGIPKACEFDPHLALVEICSRLADKGHGFAPSTIWRLLDRHNYTVKKTAHAGEQQSDDVNAALEACFKGQDSLRLSGCSSLKNAAPTPR
jgi:hypothetical protein